VGVKKKIDGLAMTGETANSKTNEHRMKIPMVLWILTTSRLEGERFFLNKTLVNSYEQNALE
jgi:hypothetical protein